MKVTVVLAVQFAASIVMTTAIFAEDEPHVMGRCPDVMGRSMLEDSTFRLHAERFVMHDLPNFELKDWPQRPEIDATIVNQIDAVKTAVPDWHGLHHMVPGSGTARN